MVRLALLTHSVKRSPGGAAHSHVDAAPLDEAILDGVLADDDSAGVAVAEVDVGVALDVEVVLPGDEGADLPADAAIGLEDEVDGADGLVGGELDGVEGGDGDEVAVDEGGPDVDVLVALVGGGDAGPVGDLLAAVDGEDVEAVVVDADLVVGVAGGEGDLEVGGQEVGDGGVEGVDGDVLEDEAGLGGLKDGPHQEDGQEEDEVEYQKPRAAPPEELMLPLPVAAAVFLRHRELVWFDFFFSFRE